MKHDRPDPGTRPNMGDDDPHRAAGREARGGPTTDGAPGEPMFEPGGEPMPPEPLTPERRRAARRNLRRSFSFLRPLWRITVVTFVFAAVMQVLPVVQVALFQGFFRTLQQRLAAGDRVADLFTQQPVIVIFAVLLGLLLITPLFKFSHELLSRMLELRLLNTIRQRIYDHVQGLSMGAFARGRTGELMRRIIEEPDAVRQVLTEVTLFPALDVILLVVVLGYLLSQNALLTAILVAFIPIYMVVFRVTNHRLQRFAEAGRDAERDLAGNVEETLSGIADIQLFGAERRRSEEFSRVQHQGLRSQFQLAKWFGIAGEGAMTINTVGRLVMLGVGFWMVTRETLAFDELFAFFALSAMLFEPALRLVGVNNLYQSLIPVLEGTWELLDEQPEVRDSPDARPLERAPQTMILDDVHFAYTPGSPVLRGLSAEVKRGQVTALVGSIGCGKSTTFNLLLRFFDPQQGRVLFDGVDAREFRIESLRSVISKLSQFPIFFKDSIEQNIRFSRPEASRDEVIAAAQQANIDRTIRERIDGGYAATVSAQFPSGGQKRLIALARCLLRRPAVRRRSFKACGCPSRRRGTFSSGRGCGCWSRFHSCSMSLFSLR